MDRLAGHWVEYVAEGTLLGIFMLLACTGVVLLEHPSSPVRRRVLRAGVRRAVMGVLMGLTAVALIYSPLGERSGAHMNPATTLTFLALGKVAGWDAMGYIVAQCIGGWLGVLASNVVCRGAVGHPAVRYAATNPGRWGSRAAWVAEWLIAFIMMTMVLNVSNTPSVSRYTGIGAGVLVAVFITFEAPVSGMSLNPARTIASAVPARSFGALWVYLTAPLAGMMSAAGVYTLSHGLGAVHCAKLWHGGGACIFQCTAGH